MENLNEIAKQMSELKPSEAKGLLMILEEDYNIVAPDTSIPVIEEVVEEKVAVQTEFDIILETAGPQKLRVVKLVKDLIGLPLRDAKYLVDRAPSTFVEGVNEAQAREYQTQFIELGAVVTIK